MLLLFLPLGAALAVPVMTVLVLFLEGLANDGFGVIEAGRLAIWQVWDWTLSEGAIYSQRYERFLIASTIAFFLGCAVSAVLFVTGHRVKKSKVPS